MKQRSPVVNQRLGDHVSLRRNSVISPSLLNTLWHRQMSSRPLMCSWFDRERSSAQEEKWRCDSLQLETSIWKHTHTYINMLLSSFVDFGMHAIMWFPYCVLYIMSLFIFCATLNAYSEERPWAEMFSQPAGGCKTSMCFENILHRRFWSLRPWFLL